MSESRGEEWEEYDKAVKWMMVTFIVTLAVTIFFALFSLPLGYLIGAGVSKGSMAVTGQFLQAVFSDPSYLISRYGSWFRQLAAYNGSFRSIRGAGNYKRNNFQQQIRVRDRASKSRTEI